MAVEGIGSGLYFSAVQGMVAQQASQASKEEKAEKTKRKSFASVLERTQKELEVQKEGFPKEIASMSIEEAVSFLKDEADMASDVLREHQTPETFADYRKKVSAFMRFLEKNNFSIKKKVHRGVNSRNKPFDPYVIIHTVNKDLDELAKWLLSSHRDTLHMLAKVNEIQGLLVDLIAE